MRIIIADDAAELPQQWAAALSNASFTALPALKSAKQRAEIAEAFVVACTPGCEPAGDSSVPVPDDGCAPVKPLPLCPPCDLRDQPELLASILDSLGVALLNRGCVAEGKRLVVLALQIRRTLLGKHHPAVAASLNSFARVLRLEDDLLRAGKAIDEALQINSKVFGSSGQPLVATYTEMGVLQLYQGDDRAAKRSAMRGLAILKRCGLDPQDPNTTRLLDVLGRALLARGRLSAARSADALFAKATKTLTRAVNIDLRQVGPNHPKYATHRGNLAGAQWAQGNLPLAETGFREVIRVYETVLNRPAHPNLLDAYANLGSVLTEAGRYLEAKEALCTALGRNQQARGPNHTLVGNDHANLGRLYFAMKADQLARQQFQKALAIYLANVKAGRLPAKHPYIAEARDWLRP